MKTKVVSPKEDPETAARRTVEEARAEADRTAATQGLLQKRTRSIIRAFGVRSPGLIGGLGGFAAAGGFGGGGGGGGGGGSSGSSGVPAQPDIFFDPFGEGGFGGSRYFY